MSAAERYHVLTRRQDEAVECPCCDGIGDFIVDEGTCPICRGTGELTAERLMALAEGLRYWLTADSESLATRQDARERLHALIEIPEGDRSDTE